MSTHDRGPGPRNLMVSGAWCLFFLFLPAWCLFFLFLPAFQDASNGQSTPSRVDRPTSGGSKVAHRDHTERDRGRSIDLYRSHCMDCHEADGRGVSSRELMRRIPDFTRPEWHGTRGDDQMRQVIRDGKGSMPPMKDKLGPEDVVLLVSLVRNFRSGGQVIAEEPEEQEESRKPPEPRELTGPPQADPRSLRVDSRSASASAAPSSDASRGAFQRFCVSCHGADGRGNALRAQIPATPDFASADWQARRSDAQLAASILEGKGTVMPAFVGKLGAVQARDVVSYVRSFAPSKAGPITRRSTDFRRRFDQLRDEIEQLDRQYRALSSH
jgi:mono/diheme cytochrome c family protein